MSGVGEHDSNVGEKTTCLSRKYSNPTGRTLSSADTSPAQLAEKDEGRNVNVSTQRILELKIK